MLHFSPADSFHSDPLTAIHNQPLTTSDTDRNWRRFVLFRVLFNSRFYYPVLAILFLDLGLSPTEYTLLNVAWAIVIVVTEIPSGVLADRFGRKPLIVAAAALMVLEMILLAVAPLHGGMALLLCCLANRVLSGIAEGMASGADEALAFDSLAEHKREKEWPLVLDQVMRWQGVGMMIAMLVGGAVYDPGFMNRLGTMLGWPLHLDQASTLRFPIYLNTITAVLVLLLAVGFREPGIRKMHAEPELKPGAWQTVADAWKWIASTPTALFVIVSGVLLDSVTRLFMTFGSSYFRLIDLPEASYGVIGAITSGIGFFVAPLASRIVKTGSVVRNFALLFGLIMLGLIGASFRWSWYGLIFYFPLSAAMMILGFTISYYLNALVDSRHRATVLSFKGFAFNLGYGFISLLFALVLRAVRDGTSEQEALARGILTLPLWLCFAGVVCAASFYSQRSALSQKV
ncbi:MAG: MFS transporter [Candidatus Methylacidiphilales bacterium]